MIANFGFDRHNAGALKEFVLGDYPCAKLASDLLTSVGSITDADQLPIGRRHGQPDFLQSMRIARAEEPDRYARFRRDRIGAGQNGGENGRSRTTGRGLEETAAVQ